MREDWIECRLEDLFFTTSGGTPSRQKSEYYNGSIPWVKSGELKSNIINETEEYITELAIEKSSAKLFPRGTILLALYGATIGRIAILGVNATTNQAICGIFETRYVITKYTYYYLQSERENLIKSGAGGAQPNISQSIVKALNYPLPPFPEQQAIVKKIEILFSSLDASIADLNKAQEQLKTYRQAVLKKAFEGELTKKWRQGKITLIENNLGNILTVSSGRNLTKTKMRPGTIPVYGGNGIMGYHNEYNKDEIKLIIGRVGVKCGVTHLTEKHSWITDNALIVNFHNPQDYDLKFMQLKLQYENLNKLSNSTAQPVISGTQIYAYKVVLPQKEEQAQIVKEIESRLSVCDRVEKQIQESITLAEALRQSILKRAFEGKLLSEEEIKSCQQAPNYEPATILLEKIKAEKEANKSRKSVKK